MKLRLTFAALIVAVLAIVLGVLTFGRSTHHASTVPTPAGVATQPAFLPGVHDTGALLDCLKGLPAVHVSYGAGLTYTDAASAERAAFHAQAVAYDKCTGRNFERPTSSDPYAVYTRLAPAGAVPLSRDNAQARAYLGCKLHFTPGTVDFALHEAYARTLCK